MPHGIHRERNTALIVDEVDIEERDRYILDRSGEASLRNAQNYAWRMPGLGLRLELTSMNPPVVGYYLPLLYETQRSNVGTVTKSPAFRGAHPLREINVAGRRRYCCHLG